MIEQAIEDLQEVEPTAEEVSTAIPIDPQAIDPQAIEALQEDARAYAIRIDDAAANLSRLIRQHAEIKEQKAISAKGFSDRLTTCESQIQRASEALEDARTEEVFDWTKDVAIRRNRVTSVEVSRRPIRREERQQHLPIPPEAIPSAPIPAAGEHYTREGEVYVVQSVSDDGDVRLEDTGGDTHVVSANAWQTSGFVRVVMAEDPAIADVGEVEQMAAEGVSFLASDPPAPKKRGRPKGSKNKEK